MNVRFSNKNVITANLVNKKNLKFENGLAIAEVQIKYKDFWNNLDTYTAITVTKEKSESEANEPYCLADEGKQYYW